ncbi:hypothetical protein O988_05042, partial [Pseudogymnoascus sp. VKM F-3808]
MAPPIIEDVEDDNYASSEDDDFVPDDAPAAAASASESEESEAEGEGEAPAAAKKGKPAAAKRKRVKQAAGGEEAEDIGFENSGDEAIIGKGLKKQRRRRRRG